MRGEEADVSIDIIIEVENKPGALADITAAVTDAGINLAAVTYTGSGDKEELHILVPHAEPVRHALALTHRAVITREHEVVVVEVHDEPGVLADLTRKIAQAGVNIDTVYVATNNRVVFGSADIAGLKKALGVA